MPRHLATPALLLALAACTLPPPQPGVTLPTSLSFAGAADPTRGAILSSAYVFGQPRTVAGNPAAAAEALGQLEFLSVELANGGRWQGGFDPLVPLMLARGRDEAREAMGLRPGIPAQGAVDALYAAAAALRDGDQARAASALTPIAAEPAGTLQRLAALPYLPQAAAATSRAQSALVARDSGRSNDWTR